MVQTDVFQRDLLGDRADEYPVYLACSKDLVDHGQKPKRTKRTRKEPTVKKRSTRKRNDQENENDQENDQENESAISIELNARYYLVII